MARVRGVSRCCLPVVSCVLIGALAAGCNDSASRNSDSHATSVDHSASEEYRTIFASLGPQIVERITGRTGLEDNELRSSEVAVNRLIWATRLPSPEWQVDYSGREIELPHLGELMILARLLNAYALWAAASNDMEASAQATAALARMSGHIGGNTIDEAVAAFGMLRLSCDLASELSTSFSRAQAQAVLTELRRVDMTDPHGGSRNLRWHVQRMSPHADVESAESYFRWAQQYAKEGLRQAIHLLE